MFKIFIILISLVFISCSAFGAEKTSKDQEIVATCLILEAGGEGNQGIHAVMSVIQNRSKERNISNYRKVVLKKNQFSCMIGDLDELIAKAKKHPKWDFAMDLAVKHDLKDITNGSTHYHVWKGRMKCSPKWSHPSLGGKNRKAIVQVYIGSHVFLNNVD